ncbi:anthranilate synthase component I family protein [Alicyclobacillus dauci]|uniref:Anthranilate synthase component 1 n=1 Tax=Alicyclobacillus dauci TaxID=1475485 RepID=A0ABY6YYS5_9BACL|nr:anthranilate synthase component I family protein [Alicyclobacillus dauci]WAH35587.1 anthranilate synthase component I family protein [Alicyclobacillus dauci]
MRTITYQQPTQGIDPFYLFLHVQSIVGDGNAFLLEAGRSDDSDLYQMSIIGVCPTVEIQIKDGLVSVFARGEAAKLFREMPDRILDTAGLEEKVWPSSVSSAPMLFRPSDPMAFLETTRIMLRDAFSPGLTQPFSAGFLGYMGYDAVHYLEKLPKTTSDDRNVPDVRLQWHRGVIHIVNDAVTLYIQDTGSSSEGQSDVFSELIHTLENASEHGLAQPSVLQSYNEDASRRPSVHYDVTEDIYCDNVKRAKEYIRQGDIFQVVLSTRIRIDNALHPYVAYDRLRQLNPSPYMFVAEYEGMRIYGASPEVQFRSTHGHAEMKPIAGTSRGRGLSREEDEALVKALKSDEKESAEHVMLVDLCRNDLGRVAKTSTVRVPDFMVVERYSHLYHLVSRVVAQLQDDVSVFHALLATFPNGTLSGAPKIRAMEIIDELETVRRGPYGGFIGMIDADANANTAIVIRTVVEIGGTQYVQVGAGIVLDSVPEREWQECHHKAGAILDVLTGERVTN